MLGEKARVTTAVPTGAGSWGLHPAGAGRTRCRSLIPCRPVGGAGQRSPHRRGRSPPPGRLVRPQPERRPRSMRPSSILSPLRQLVHPPVILLDVVKKRNACDSLLRSLNLFRRAAAVPWEARDGSLLSPAAAPTVRAAMSGRTTPRLLGRSCVHHPSERLASSAG